MAKDVIDCGVTTETLDLMNAYNIVDDGANGAVTSFVGVVRDRNQGRDVLGVTYDCFDALGDTTLKKLCTEAAEKWGPINVYCWHHKGRLEVGGISVIIAVSSPHRDESFKACRYIIEEVKHRVPVWKKEHYVDGDSEWTEGCELCHSHDDEDHDHGHEHSPNHDHNH